jgi:hypothetical protein
MTARNCCTAAASPVPPPPSGATRWGRIPSTAAGGATPIVCPDDVRTTDRGAAGPVFSSHEPTVLVGRGQICNRREANVRAAWLPALIVVFFRIVLSASRLLSLPTDQCVNLPAWPAS